MNTDVLCQGGPHGGQIVQIPHDRTEWKFILHELPLLEIPSKNAVRIPDPGYASYDVHKVYVKTCYGAFKRARIAVPQGTRLPAGSRRIEQFIRDQPLEWPAPSIVHDFENWWAWVTVKYGVADPRILLDLDSLLGKLPDEFLFRTKWADYSPQTRMPHILLTNV